MSYQLRMSAEIGDWLTDLAATEPLVASAVGAALTATLEAGSMPGQPLVTDLASGAVPATGRCEPAATDGREDLDCAYQELLESQQLVRRQAASAAVDRLRAADELAALQGQAQPDPDALRHLRRRHNAALLAERQLVQRSQRLQRDVNDFWSRKETAKALYTAALATASIQEATRELHQTMRAAGQPEARSEADEAEVVRAVHSAESKLRALMEHARRLQQDLAEGSGGPGHAADSPAAGVAAQGLLELAADPGCEDIRILFAQQPQDTMWLLAVLHGRDAVSRHRQQAIELASELLQESRANTAPDEVNADAATTADAGAEPADLTFTGAPAFLEHFFADDGDTVRQEAASLGTRSTLAQLRIRRGIDQAELAELMGVGNERVQAIEDEGLADIKLHQLAAYLRALGCRLDLTATFDGESTKLT